ncbi:hypothetical protein KAW55_07065 [bacterium]|nr:hypothetical protein [bacterium]
MQLLIYHTAKQYCFTVAPKGYFTERGDNRGQEEGKEGEEVEEREERMQVRR